MGINFGTATPSSYYIGSASVSKIYCGSVQVWPVVTATFYSFNSTWTAIGFSGSGTSASPYTKANYGSNIAGMQATVTSAGTVRITGQMYSDFGIDFYKNGTLLGYPPSISDNYSGNGGNYTLNVSITVAAGDAIRIGDEASGDFYSIPSTALNIWWQ